MSKASTIPIITNHVLVTFVISIMNQDLNGALGIFLFHNGIKDILSVCCINYHYVDGWKYNPSGGTKPTSFPKKTVILVTINSMIHYMEI